jgi:hypothetical protein
LMSLRNNPSRTRILGVCVAVLAALTALLSVTSPARATVNPAIVIDGPSPTILDVDGSALAPDGSGGILYRKLVAGQPRLFVARFANGSWQPPVEADAGQPFGASSPAIAAGNEGRLLVVWAEPWAVINQVTQYQLMSAELSPGASGFGPAVQVDPDSIGDGSAAFPSLAMAPNGNAYVVYRVVTNPLEAGSTSTTIPLRHGDELVAVRVAHYNGQGLPWTSLGAINQFPQLTMRRPTAANAPAIGVSNLGSAVVAWQEPDGTGYARIWARRIFGNTLGNVLPVSPTTANGQPIDVDADAPAISVTPLGEARVAFRLAGGPGSPYGQARIFVNDLPPTTATNGNQFIGPHPVAAASTIGPPSISLSGSGGTGAYQLAFTAGAEADTLTGDDYHGNGTPVTLGTAQGERTLSTAGLEGGGVTAWRATNGTGLQVIDVREDFAGGAWQLAQLSAPLGGSLDEPALGGAGLGDALVAFRQGPVGQSQVMAAVVKAPPGEFLVETPIGWVKGIAAKISWNAAPEAYGKTTYAVVVDGQIRQRGLTELRAHLSSRGLGNGIHQVQVLATDELGQQTMTAAAELKVDAGPPEVRVRRLGQLGVRVRVIERYSGAVARATLIDFGDGTRSVKGKLSARHTYAHAGIYVIVVHDKNAVGNRGVAHIRVQVV